ncbi:hypothetical protein INT47_001413 [Mucor saturninus]|uniref:Putative gamma-glutamylcyclotransferase n=1 Tax=Mucor saturninus TaxID=64648 RepID=A0A8H7QZW3_9FUNG|nr:hypothetical protein INT47_001413 [Mucor saturninus]
MSKVVLSRVLCGTEVSQHDESLKMNSVKLVPATLKGYTRSSLKGEEYPAITQTEGQGKVKGVLAQGLTETDIKALDVFEGDWYQRIPVQVTSDEDGTTFDTNVYLYVGDMQLLTGTDWSFQQFLESGKEQKWLDDRCDFFDVDNFHRAS